MNELPTRARCTILEIGTRVQDRAAHGMLSLVPDFDLIEAFLD